MKVPRRLVTAVRKELVSELDALEEMRDTVEKLLADKFEAPLQQVAAELQRSTTSNLNLQEEIFDALDKLSVLAKTFGLEFYQDSKNEWNIKLAPTKG